jgi:hypothetical protein
VAVLTVVAVTPSCSKDEYCVEGLDIGTTYRVTVLEPANANSQYAVQTSNGPDFGVGMYISDSYTCGAGFDFVAGSTFLLRPVAREDLMACYGRIGYVSDVQEVQLVQRMDGLTSSAGDVLIRPEYKIQKGACSGIWELGFTSSHSDSPLKTPVPGAYPPVLMVRTFLSDATTDLQSCLLLDSKLTASSSCSDYFVVKLEKT